MNKINRSDSEGIGGAGRDMNRDPLSGKPGAHPVGTGTGAAIGATVGGIVGAIGGPVGIAAGAAAGGVAGGLVGKGAAEYINPTGEVEYWRDVFPSRPYASGRQFNDFAPVYYSTAEAYQSNNGSSFEDVEPELQRKWTGNPSNSRLSWSEARDASKDAWDRLAKNTRGMTSEPEHEAAEDVNSLVELLYDGAKGFKEASEFVKDPQFRNGFAHYSEQRTGFIEELKPMIAMRGEKPDHSGSLTGLLHRGWIGLKSAFSNGDKAILSECERGEDAVVAKYRKVLQSGKLTPELSSVIHRQYTQVQQAHDTVKTWRDSVT